MVSEFQFSIGDAEAGDKKEAELVRISFNSLLEMPYDPKTEYPLEVILRFNSLLEMRENAEMGRRRCGN